MKIMKVTNPEAVVKAAYWLAWKACGGPLGMGVLQDRPGANKDDVWAQVKPIETKSRPGNWCNGDYVFGRMMKLYVKFDADSIHYDDHEPHPEYQAWCRLYPTYESLLLAACESLAV